MRKFCWVQVYSYAGEATLLNWLRQYKGEVTRKRIWEDSGEYRYTPYRNDFDYIEVEFVIYSDTSDEELFASLNATIDCRESSIGKVQS
jgi:hypothetical protein